MRRTGAVWRGAPDSGLSWIDVLLPGEGQEGIRNAAKLATQKKQSKLKNKWCCLTHGNIIKHSYDVWTCCSMEIFNAQLVRLDQVALYPQFRCACLEKYYWVLNMPTATFMLRLQEGSFVLPRPKLGKQPQLDQCFYITNYGVKLLPQVPPDHILLLLKTKHSG